MRFVRTLLTTCGSRAYARDDETFSVPAHLLIIPAQAGIHLARNTFKARSDGVTSAWIPGLRPG